MEIIVTLATKFWQWSILIAVVIITFLINLLDKKKKNDLTFHADEMPELKPVPIKTKGKGFWKGIVMWLLSTRNWEITKDWKYRINGNEYKYIPVENGELGCIVNEIGSYVCNVSYIGRTKVQGFTYVLGKKVNVELNLKTLKFVK